MKKLILLLLTSAVFGCSRQNESAISEVDKDLFTVDNPASSDSLIAIIKFDSIYQDIFPNAVTGIELTRDEIAVCEELLRDQVKEYNLSALKKVKELTKKYPDQKFDLHDFEIALKPSGRQYLAVISKNGDKLVYVNYLCDPTLYDNWETRLVQVEDGGNCYFSLRVNLTTRKGYDFRVNGDA